MRFESAHFICNIRFKKRRKKRLQAAPRKQTNKQEPTTERKKESVNKTIIVCFLRNLMLNTFEDFGFSDCRWIKWATPHWACLSMDVWTFFRCDDAQVSILKWFSCQFYKIHTHGLNPGVRIRLQWIDPPALWCQLQLLSRWKLSFWIQNWKK